MMRSDVEGVNGRVAVSERSISLRPLPRAEGGRYHILTYGCQMNEHDSEVLAGLLETMGYRPAPIGEADIILLNTCSIRENAVERVLGKLGELKGLKRRRPDLLLGVCGCLPQQEGQAERLLRQAPHLDLVFGTHNLHELPQLVRQARLSALPVVDLWEKAGPVVEHLPVRRPERVKAYVNVSFGCNKMCTYCVVPSTRGRERSRRPEDIEAEVRALANDGCREVMLLGQTVNSYGKDLRDGTNFASLLRRLDRIDGIERIRYMSSHPRDFSDELIETIASSRAVCEHFHMPVQAGSNRVLRAMHRSYRIERYLELVDRVRRAIPHASITTDIIVGFPGETEADFQETLDVVRRVRFDSAYTFIYSPRPGTPAASFPDQVPEPVKRERLQRLMGLQDAISREINEGLVGQVCEVLIEGPSKKDPRMLSGRTRTFKLVNFPGDAAAVGRLARVRITGAKTFALTGELV